MLHLERIRAPKKWVAQSRVEVLDSPFNRDGDKQPLETRTAKKWHKNQVSRVAQIHVGRRNYSRRYVITCICQLIKLSKPSAESHEDPGGGAVNIL